MFVFLYVLKNSDKQKILINDKTKNKRLKPFSEGDPDRVVFDEVEDDVLVTPFVAI